MITTRVVVLLERYQPGRPLSSIEAEAIGAPPSVVSHAFTGTWYDLNGWEWSHFQPRDRVIVFGAPDPQTGRQRIQRGTVTAVDPLGMIDVLLDDGTEHRRNPDTEGQISHLSGGCRCSTPLYP